MQRLNSLSRSRLFIQILGSKFSISKLTFRFTGGAQLFWSLPMMHTRKMPLLVIPVNRLSKFISPASLSVCFQLAEC